MHPTIQDKLIASILIAHSLLGSLWTYSASEQLGFPPGFLASNLALSAAGLAAGIGYWNRRRWAAILGILFLAVQLFHIVTPTFQFSFTLGLNLNIDLGWIESGVLGINLFALVMLLWLSHRAIGTVSSAKPIKTVAGDST